MNEITYTIDRLKELVNIPSPTGMTHQVQQYLMETLNQMGYSPKNTRKGTVLTCLGGEGHPLLLMAHVDTLGAIVRAVKPNGALHYAKIGGYEDATIENENVCIYTMKGKCYTGTVRANHASKHVYGGESEKRDDTTMEVTLDECVYSKKDTEALGISAGDYICFEPRFTVTDSGFIKTRHLDDKASSALLLALAKQVKHGAVALGRKVYIMFTVYEEVGHGASSILPDDIEDLLAVDMGCVGDDLGCKETQVSICIKDSAGPFHYEWTKEICLLADKHHINYCKDIYPFYSSDTATALKAGLEARHALIGPAVFASHSYERTHVKALEETLLLLKAVCEAH